VVSKICFLGGHVDEEVGKLRFEELHESHSICLGSRHLELVQELGESVQHQALCFGGYALALQLR